MKVIIDRFEDEFAVVELSDRRTANLSRILLPEACEGDVVEIKVLKNATSERKREIDRLAKDVWEDQ